MVFTECLSGKFAGRKMVKVTGMIDKGCRITVSNPVLRDTDGSMDIVECVENRNLCFVHWLLILKSKCRAYPTNRLYIREAKGKVCKVSLNCVFYCCFYFICFLSNLRRVLFYRIF